MGRKKFNMDPKKVHLKKKNTHTHPSILACLVVIELYNDDSLCRASYFWWTTSCSDTLKKTLPSFSTKERASTRLQ